MRVYIHSCVNVAVAQPLLDNLNWGAGFEQERAVCMPEAVNGDVLQFVLSFKRVQPIIHCWTIVSFVFRVFDENALLF